MDTRVDASGLCLGITTERGQRLHPPTHMPHRLVAMASSLVQGTDQQTHLIHVAEGRLTSAVPCQEGADKLPAAPLLLAACSCKWLTDAAR